MNRKNIKRKVYPEQRRRVAVALSGGVDSSVSAALLKEQGFDVVGVFMKVWSGRQSPDHSRPTKTVDRRPLTVDQCPWIEDQFEARRAAEHLGIPFYTVNLEKEYKKAVVDYFFSEYAVGRTPNPDVLCNSEIKFGVFLKRMLAMGADFIATGHYARIQSLDPGNSKHEALNSKQIQNSNDRNLPVRQAGSKRLKSLKFENLKIVSDFGFRNSDLKKLDIQLLRGVDPRKDQSYFLWRLTQDQLKHVLFPVGGYTKAHVRELAEQFGLPNANRKDSQGICFIGPVDVVEFLKTQLPVEKGLVVTTDGQKVGEHKGVWFYTIGQRHGWKPVASKSLRLPGSEPALLGPSEAQGAYALALAHPDILRDTLPAWAPRVSSPGQTFAQSDRPALYVIEKNLKTNTLIVGPADDPKLWTRGMAISQVVWQQPIWSLKVPRSEPILSPSSDGSGSTRSDSLPAQGGTMPAKPARVSSHGTPFRSINCKVQIRYQQKPIACRIKPNTNNQFEVIFNEPVRAVTPGQSAVFYDCDTVIGGGVIERALF